MHADQIVEFGNPAEVAEVIELPDPPTPGRDEVQIALEFAQAITRGAAGQGQA